MSIVEVSFGEIVSNELVPRFKAKHGRTHIISIVSNRPKAVKTYNCNQRMVTDANGNKSNILGTIHATDDLLPILGVPAQHYWFPVIEYSLFGASILNEQGLPNYGMPVTFRALKTSEANYQKFVTIAQQVKDPTGLDFTVSVVGGEKKEMYQELAVNEVRNSTGLWKQLPGVYEDIVNKMLPMYESVFAKLVGEKVPVNLVVDYLNGRPADDIKKELLGSGVSPVSNVSIVKPALAYNNTQAIGPGNQNYLPPNSNTMSQNYAQPVQHQAYNQQVITAPAPVLPPIVDIPRVDPVIVQQAPVFQQSSQPVIEYEVPKAQAVIPEIKFSDLIASEEESNIGA